MPDISASLDFLADLDLYKQEKPYYVFCSVDDSLPQTLPITNLQLVRQHGINITDIRGKESLYTIESHGFEILSHRSALRLPVLTDHDLEVYKHETEAVLRKRFNASIAYCYEARTRKNDHVDRETMDFRDPMLVEKPAYGIHIDATIDSGPQIAYNHLPDELLPFLTSGKRLRLVNTWRSMRPVVEDRPLVFSDYFTVDKTDLMAADRVYPFIAGEVYYLKYNPKTRWYWLSHMTDEEPIMMLTYDSAPGKGARYCAHASCDNPLAPSNAPFRYSLETRTILISDS